MRLRRVVGGSVLVAMGAAWIWASYNVERPDGSFVLMVVGIIYAGFGLILALAKDERAP